MMLNVKQIPKWYLFFKLKSIFLQKGNYRQFIKDFSNLMSQVELGEVTNFATRYEMQLPSTQSGTALIAHFLNKCKYYKPFLNAITGLLVDFPVRVIKTRWVVLSGK